MKKSNWTLSQSHTKRINLLWRVSDWELLERVKKKLGEESDAATLRRSLKIVEAFIDKGATIDGREILLPR